MQLPFYMLTLHNGAGTKALRRVFSVRMLGDDIRYAQRTWVTSPGFPGAFGITIGGCADGAQIVTAYLASHLV